MSDKEKRAKLFGYAAMGGLLSAGIGILLANITGAPINMAIGYFIGGVVCASVVGRRTKWYKNR